MPRNILITGITGQDGSFLAESCLADGDKVYGLIRRTATTNTRNIKHILHNITLVDGDLCDSSSLFNAVKISEPDEVYNLAAQSFVASSFKEPEYTFKVNTLGTMHLLNAIVQNGMANHTRFYQAGTSEMFGNSLDGVHNGGICFYNEQSKMKPVSPYGISKLAAYNIIRMFRDTHSMHACTGILFNHESERRGGEFVTMKICKGLQRIKDSWGNHLPQPEWKIHLGNIEAYRDWGYARDYVEAMKLMLRNAPNDEPCDYVIGTGQPHSIKEFIMECMDALYQPSFLSWNVVESSYIEIDEKFVRPIDINVLAADSSKAERELGWKPKTDFSQLVRTMLFNKIREI